MRMIEAEQQHRIHMEQYALPAQVNAIRNMQILGGVVSVAAVLGAVGLGYLGTDWRIPLSMIAIPVASIFGVSVSDYFVGGKNKADKEPDDKESDDEE